MLGTCSYAKTATLAEIFCKCYSVHLSSLLI
jgi:hypothetical protein